MNDLIECILIQCANQWNHMIKRKRTMKHESHIIGNVQGEKHVITWISAKEHPNNKNNYLESGTL